jgi:L-fucose mutarotase
MLKHRLIHPQINKILGRAGHHATILIADGHFPASTKKGPNADVVCLNLMPGVVTCSQALEAVLSAIPVDAVTTMMYTKDDPYALERDPPVWDEYRDIIRKAGLALELTPVEKWAFYEAVATPDHVLTIQTADLQRYANILLSIGVRMDL